MIMRVAAELDQRVDLSFKFRLVPREKAFNCKVSSMILKDTISLMIYLSTLLSCD